MSLVVHRPGLLTTVQDLGRWGHQSAGVPVAGPMDSWSHRLGNRALGNADGAAVLEVTIIGPLIECEVGTRMAITGATCPITIDGEHVRSPLLLEAAAGTMIDIGECQAGTRGYVAVAGGFDVPVVLGSRSTDLRSGFGGYGGRAVHAGDRLHYAAAPVHPAVRELPGAAVGPARDRITRLRVMRGPAEEPAADRAFIALTRGSFRVSSQSDRMGYRLEGGVVAVGTTASMVTAPTTMGLVQVPPSGEPILLMADRHTTGGYAAVAVVITADLPLAGQLGPGHAVTFEACTLEDARRALRQMEAHLTAIGERVHE
jgi:antagonist of KipI